MGTDPFALAFDGSNMWVVVAGSQSVIKLRASDGVSLGSFPVGAGAFAIAFDGANMWVANFNGNDISKL